MILPSPNVARRPSRKTRLARKTSSRPAPLPAPNPENKRQMNIDSQEQFTSAIELLRRLGQAPEISEQFEIRNNTRMVYTNGVTLWLLILQRLGKGLSLEKTVSHVIESLCHGCGNCTVVCPAGAPDLAGFNHEQILAQVLAA